MLSILFTKQQRQILAQAKKHLYTKAKTPMKYTVNDFRKDYPSEAVCLDKLFQLRFSNLEACPRCGVIDGGWRRITTRRAYQCQHCYHQIYPTAGTIMEKSRTSLVNWFFVMYLMTVTRNGVSAMEVQRQLGVSYKCAWSMLHKIRRLMSAGLGERIFSGNVEMDETLMGGKEKNKHKNKRTKGTQGMSLKTKTAVFAIVERQGEVRAVKVDDLQQKTVMPIIIASVSKNAKISTDESKIYKRLTALGFDHGFIKHAQEEYKRGSICTNTVEGFFSQLKRMVKGTHISVSEKHLQKYLDECSYRYNRRGLKGLMFIDLLSQVTMPRGEHFMIPRTKNRKSNDDFADEYSDLMRLGLFPGTNGEDASQTKP